MVTVARVLNLTLVVPELDKSSFWADPRYINCFPHNLDWSYSSMAVSMFVTLITYFFLFSSNFGDIFDVRHFIDSLRDEVRIIRRLPKRYNRKYGFIPLEMPPVSWSNEKYYIQQVILFSFLVTFKQMYILLVNLIATCSIIVLTAVVWES